MATTSRMQLLHYLHLIFPLYLETWFILYSRVNQHLEGHEYWMLAKPRIVDLGAEVRTGDTCDIQEWCHSIPACLHPIPDTRPAAISFDSGDEKHVNRKMTILPWTGTWNWTWILRLLRMEIMIGGKECWCWDLQNTVLSRLFTFLVLIVRHYIIDKGHMLSFLDSHLLVLLLEYSLHL